MTYEDYKYVCECELAHSSAQQANAVDDVTLVDDANVFGQFACAQAIAKIWIKSGFKEGSIILTSSMSSQIVNRGIHQVFYNSSKAAVGVQAHLPCPGSQSDTALLQASSIVKQLAVEW